MGTVTWVPGSGLARVPLARVQVEGGVLGGAGRERMRPGGLQVHRAGQDQARGGADDAGAEQVADLAGGLLRDELVDLLPGLLRGPAEVGVAHRDGRGGGHRRGEAGLQRQARLDPHRVRRAEGEVAGGQVAEERRDGLQLPGRPRARVRRRPGWPGAGPRRSVPPSRPGPRAAPGAARWRCWPGRRPGCRGQATGRRDRPRTHRRRTPGHWAGCCRTRGRRTPGRRRHRAAGPGTARHGAASQGPGAPGGPAPRAAPLPSCSRRT